jgi:transcriptional regulator with XRE-family HTH domain
MLQYCNERLKMLEREITLIMKPSEQEQFGTALRRARTRAGLSVRALATKSGLTAATVSRLETGHIESPRPEHLQRLARALDVDVEDFYALAGYLMPEGLPELRPYLRAKYQLPDQAARQLDEYFQALRERWRTNEEGHHERGDSNR